MLVTISQYHHFLSKEKKKHDFVHNIISVLRAGFPGVQIELLSNDNSYAQQLPPGISFIQIDIPSLLKPIARKKFISGVRSIVKKSPPDLLISGGVSATGLPVPEYMLVTDLQQIALSELRNASRWIVPSVYMQELLIKRGMNADKVIVARVLPGELYMPAGWEERESLKQKLTGGKEYFVVNTESISEKRIVNVLKAFSLFKKWQQSNMQLLLVNPEDAPKINTLLQTYKYRNDVKVIASATAAELATFIKAAMAYISLPESDITGYSTAIALQSNVPAIAYDIGAVRETAGEAVLYTDAENSEDIAGKMIKLYKDEKLRALLIRRSQERIAALKQENESIHF
jgi:glycosyltransferase involved in cell wall biosynthesis